MPSGTGYGLWSPGLRDVAAAGSHGVTYADSAVARPAHRAGIGGVPVRIRPYFANAPRLADDISALLGSGDPVVWFCPDGAAIGDIDHSTTAQVARVQERL